MSRSGSPLLQKRPKRPSRRLSPRPVGDAGRAPGQRGRRFWAWAGSIAAHLMAFTALFWPYAASTPATPSPILVNLVTLPRQAPAPPGSLRPPGPPGPAGTPDAAAKASIGKVTAVLPAPRPAPAQVAAHTATPDSVSPAPDDTSDLLSDSQLAGAASAGGEGASGGGGGGCDTARAVQQALRRDPLVHTAVEDAHRLGKSVMLWNGDWVRSGAQDGKGLSAVREAIIWEVAFAPEACRNARVHGLVLLTLADGNTRFAIGAGDWRWSDLLTAR